MACLKHNSGSHAVKADDCLNCYMVVEDLLLVGALALKMVEHALAHSYRLGSNLYIFVCLDVFETFLKAHHSLRYDAGLVVRT